jgi:excinuclease UvrABC helicase subunit UvrB
MLTLLKRVEMYPVLDPKAQKLVLKELQLQMEIYADMQEYEKAAECRDLLKDLEKDS